MNSNKTYKEKEIKNRLSGFQENQDYSVSPTEQSEVKNYIFHNDSLKNIFGVERVPVRVWKDKYEDENVKYRGHFEEGKNYYFSHQEWRFGENYPTDSDGWKPIWKRQTKHGDGSYLKESMRSRSLGNNPEPLHHLPHYLSSDDGRQLTELKVKHNSLVAQLNSLLIRPESEFGVNGKEKKEHEIAQVKKDIAEVEKWIEDVRNSQPQYKTNHSDERDEHLPQNRPEKSNDDSQKVINELHKQLTKTQQELARIIEILKEQNNPKLTAELVKVKTRNQKLTQKAELPTESELQNSLKQSNEVLSKAAVAASKTQSQTVSNPKGNENKTNPVPYLVGGGIACLLVGSLIIYSWMKRNKKSI